MPQLGNDPALGVAAVASVACSDCVRDVDLDGDFFGTGTVLTR